MRYLARRSCCSSSRGAASPGRRPRSRCAPRSPSSAGRPRPRTTRRCATPAGARPDRGRRVDRPAVRARARRAWATSRTRGSAIEKIDDPRRQGLGGGPNVSGRRGAVAGHPQVGQHRRHLDDFLPPEPDHGRRTDQRPDRVPRQGGAQAAGPRRRRRGSTPPAMPGSRRSASSSTATGTCSGSAVRGAAPARTRTAPARATPTRSSTTCNDRRVRHLRGAGRVADELDQVLAVEAAELELVGIQDHPYQRRFFDTLR